MSTRVGPRRPVSAPRSRSPQATPHVAGVAARLLQRTPAATPAEIQDAITSGASPDVVTGVPRTCAFFTWGCVLRTPNRVLQAPA